MDSLESKNVFRQTAKTDQSARMRQLIWVFAGRTYGFVVNVVPGYKHKNCEHNVRLPINKFVNINMRLPVHKVVNIVHG